MTDFIPDNPTFSTDRFNSRFGPRAAAFKEQRKELFADAERAFWDIMQVSDNPSMYLLPLPLEHVENVLQPKRSSSTGALPSLPMRKLVEKFVDCIIHHGASNDFNIIGWRNVLKHAFCLSGSTKAYTVLSEKVLQAQVFHNLMLNGNMPVVYEKYGTHGLAYYVVLNQRPDSSGLNDRIHLWCVLDFEQGLELAVKLAYLCHVARQPGNYKVPPGATRLPRGLSVVGALVND